jgi:hypothetical protein
MKRVARTLLVGVGAALVMGAPVRADETGVAPPPGVPAELAGAAANYRSDAVRGTPEEAEVLRLYRARAFLSARTAAERLIEANPESAIGHFVLGGVLRDAEGSLARAMAHLGRARGSLEHAYGPQPPEGPLTELHREILHASIGAAGELEEYAFQQQLLDYHDALYEPDRIAERAWLELKRRNLERARELAKRAASAPDAWQRSLGKNALCAIEAEARDRGRADAACRDALENARARAAAAEERGARDPTGPGIAVHAYNAALAARGLLKDDDAERLLREGARTREPTIASPWRLLTRLYLDQARYAEALGAATELREWNVRLPASLREQAAAENDATLALVLLVIGEPERSLALVERALERPDRRGLTSVRAEQALAGNALLRRAVLASVRERARERASARGVRDRVRLWLASLLWPLERTLDDERIRGVLANEDRLEATLRAHVNGGIEPNPTWLLGDLIDVLGAGVVEAGLGRARSADAAFPAAAPLHDAVEAELEQRRGAHAHALELAERALAGLPRGAALLRARVTAVAALAAEVAAPERALELYARVFDSDPGMLRRLQLRVPVRVAHGTAGASTAELLARSPRLRVGDTGLALTVEETDTAIRVCLFAPNAVRVSCSETPQGPDPEAAALRAVDAFHERAFAPRVDLVAAELNSLDGSTTVANEAQRERLRALFEALAAD